MENFKKLGLLFAVITMAVVLMPRSIPAAAAEQPSFRGKIDPILKTYCRECHRPGGAGYEESGLDLRTYDGLMRGTKHGPVVTPGDAFTSNLMVLIEGRADKSITMPHKTAQPTPTKTDRRVIRAWIAKSASDNDVFQNAVRPILDKYCLACHQPGGKGYETSGLDMRTHESLMKGTKFGPVIVPRDPFTSNFMVVMEGRAGASLRMPHSERRDLSKAERQLIRAWINQGATNN